MIFNQFEEMGNYIWHYQCDRQRHLRMRYESIEAANGDRFAGAAFTSSGSSRHDGCRRPPEGSLSEQRKLGGRRSAPVPDAALENGFGAHRIEGIGDKHVPWIHNVKNTDFVFDIDDEDSARSSSASSMSRPAMKLPHRTEGGVPADLVDQL
jgi:cysteine synthase A